MKREKVEHFLLVANGVHHKILYSNHEMERCSNNQIRSDQPMIESTKSHTAWNVCLVIYQKVDTKFYWIDDKIWENLSLFILPIKTKSSTQCCSGVSCAFT